jgi:hypothetical protein
MGIDRFCSEAQGAVSRRCPEARLPEFRPTFDQFVEEENGEFGSYWAVNEVHRWSFPQNDPHLLRRVFDAFDEVYADQTLRDGNDLAIEFFEAVCEAGRAGFDAYIGPHSREWFDRHGW